MVDAYLVSSYINSITSPILGLFVYLKGRKPLHRYWFLMSLCVAVWAFLVGMERIIVDQEFNLLVNRVELAFTVWIPVFFLHSVMYFVSSKLSRHNRTWLSLAYLATLGLFVLAPTRLLIESLTPQPIYGDRPYDVAGRLYVLFPILYTVIVTKALHALIRARRGSSRIRRAQLTLTAIATGIGFIAGGTCFPLVFGIQIPPVGFHVVWCHSLLITYAIFRYDLWDLRPVIRRSLVYSILVTMLTAGYFGAVYAIEQVFRTTMRYQSIWMSVVAFAVMGLAFQPLKGLIQRAVDWLLFRAPQEELVKRMERLEEEARHTEKLKAVATLAAGMAHEIKNPLSSIKTFAEHLPEKYEDPAFREKFTRIISQEVSKINFLVQQLLDFAKPMPPQRRPARLSHVIDETIELLHGPLAQRRVEVVRAYTQQDSVFVDPNQMKQVFLNLLLNSIEATTRPGCVTVTTVAENSHLEVQLADCGPGISPKDLPHVFDPFYTTKPHGTGLGLSVVHSIVREHGGRITLDSRVGRGTTVRIRLPLNGGANGAGAHPDRG